MTMFMAQFLENLKGSSLDQWEQQRKQQQQQP